MKKFTFTNIPEFCECLSNTYCEVTEDDELNSVSVVAKYDDMKVIVEELICIGYGVHAIELEPEDYSNYYDEYLCVIYDDEIFVEKMKHEKGYYNIEDNVTFVLGDCNSKALDHVKSDIKYEVEICEKNGETCDCACCDDKLKTDKLTVTVNGKKITDEKEKIKTLNRAIADFEAWDDFFFNW